MWKISISYCCIASSHLANRSVCHCPYVTICIAICSSNCTACFSFATVIVNLTTATEGTLQCCSRRRSQLTERNYSNRLFEPLFAAVTCLLLQCSAPNSFCLVPPEFAGVDLCAICSFLSEATSNVGLNFFLRMVN